jgi:hypothetical protein
VPILSDFLPKLFSIDAFYPHREHLPAKVRTFIDLLVEILRQFDWDLGAYNGGNSSSPVVQAASIDPLPAQKRTNSVTKGPGIGRSRR